MPAASWQRYASADPQDAEGHAVPSVTVCAVVTLCSRWPAGVFGQGQRAPGLVCRSVIPPLYRLCSSKDRTKRGAEPARLRPPPVFVIFVRGPLLGIEPGAAQGSQPCVTLRGGGGRGELIAVFLLDMCLKVPGGKGVWESSTIQE